MWKVCEGMCVGGREVWEGVCVGGCICGYHDNLTIKSHDIMHQRVHWSVDI